jgi:hypothetical protein
LVTQLTAETRVAVERHPHVMQMMHVGTESALLTHGVLGPPELATRAHINARLFGSPAYADLREFIRRLLSAHDVAADVMAAIDRAAQAAIDAANGVAPVADSTASLGAAVPTPAADVPAVPGGADATAKTQTQLVHALLARKPVARPLAKPSVRAVALASRAKVVTKTTIILPYDAIMIGRRLIQAAERGDASSEDFDSDDDDDSASSSEAPAAQSAPSTVMAPTAEADDGTTPAAAATTAATTHKFSCETCGKGFRRKRDMSSHMVNQHGAEPTSDLHVCTDCPMAFAYPNKLASHRQAKHGAAPPEPTTKVRTSLPKTASSPTRRRHHRASRRRARRSANVVAPRPPPPLLLLLLLMLLLLLPMTTSLVTMASV